MSESHLPRTWKLTGRGIVIGGTERHGGWVTTARITVDLQQLTIGITWQADEFEDPDPLIALHLPGVYLWLRFYRVRPGYRAKRRRAAR